MPKRILIAALVAVLCGGFGAPEALANQLAYRYWLTFTDQNWKGSRVTVNNPVGSEMSIQAPNDFDLTSAYAEDAEVNLIQIGVTYEWQAAQNSCNLGSSAPALYYFTETWQSGVQTCYNLGYASGGAQNRMSVQRGSDNLWHAYQNGVGAGVSNSWTNCGGDACLIAAFAENYSYKPGYYYAKFAGANQTPWQYYNGSTWNTISSTPNPPEIGAGWHSPTGPFPTGIWSFYFDSR